jgi:hypothetical protein
MPSLSLKKSKGGRPVAVVRGGARDGEILYCNADKPVADGTEVELDEGEKFQVIPTIDPDQRSVYYIAGMSGAGKSHFARGIAEAYKKLYPSRQVYLISELKEDATLDGSKIAKPLRISLDSLVEEPPEIDEFSDCLVIFDDYDALSKPYDAVVLKLMKDLLTMGRHTHCSLCICSHHLSNGLKTRLILNESQYLVLYPMATAPKALAYTCEMYGGIDKDDVKELKKLGRWVCIHKMYPGFVVSEKKAYLLNV